MERHDDSDLPDLRTARRVWDRFDDVPRLEDVVRTLINENPAYLKEYEEPIPSVIVTHVVGMHQGRFYHIAGHRKTNSEGRLQWTSIKYAAPCDPNEWKYDVSES